MRPTAVSAGTTKNPEVVWDTRSADTPVPEGSGHTTQIAIGRHINTPTNALVQWFLPFLQCDPLIQFLMW